MVAVERMKLAEAEEELREAQAEKDALRSALRLMERQSSREPSASPERKSRSGATMHSHKRSSSSAIAIKSLPSSTPSSPRSVVHVVDDSSPLSRNAAPPPLNLPQVGLAKSDIEHSPTTEGSQREASSSEDQVEEKCSEVNRSTITTPPELGSEPSADSSTSPTPGNYANTSAPRMSYFEAEESPWADVKPSTPATAAF